MVLGVVLRTVVHRVETLKPGIEEYLALIDIDSFSNEIK